MEPLALQALPLQNLAVWGVAAGLLLLVWVLVGRQIRIGSVDLPAIESRPIRYIVGAIASCVILVSCFILLGGPQVVARLMSPARPTLRVLTGLAEEELKVFAEIVKQFGREHRLTVHVDNVTWEQALDKLKDEPIDLITFDITARRELVQHGLVEELPSARYKGLIPSAVHPALMEHLDIDDRRYFVPFRPNVRLVFLNKHKFEELDEKYQALDEDHPNLPRTWQDVLEVAKRFYARDGEARVVIEATDTDAPLFLLELIRSAGGDPLDLLHPQSVEAVEFLRELWPHVSAKASRADWQTVTGFLLADSVYWGRNWTWTLTIIHNSGRDEDFVAYPGWRWQKSSRPSYLLGGELLAVPKNARHKDRAIELMTFLTSREVQTKIVAELSWPAMRLDAIVGLKDWQQRYQRAINQALLHAEPVPVYWQPNLAAIYRRLFYAVTHLKSNTEIETSLMPFQREIEAWVEKLGIRTHP